jgi:hypothetical protein
MGNMLMLTLPLTITADQMHAALDILGASIAAASSPAVPGAKKRSIEPKGAINASDQGTPIHRRVLRSRLHKALDGRGFCIG